MLIEWQMITQSSNWNDKNKSAHWSKYVKLSCSEFIPDKIYIRVINTISNNNIEVWNVVYRIENLHFVG